MSDQTSTLKVETNVIKVMPIENEVKENKGRTIEEEVEVDIILEEVNKKVEKEVKTEDKFETETKDEITLEENVRKSSSWTEAQTTFKNVMIPKPEEENVKQVKLKYILNELKNMKVAKVNAKKTTTIHRIEKDDLNIRYELNSGLYLGLKEELDLMDRGYTWGDNDNDIKMVLEGKHNEEDKAANNPKTVFRWKVIDIKNSFESKVTMNLYHTNQGVHIQGGRRHGQVTACSIAGDMFETWSMIVAKQKAERIMIIKETILGMDLRRKPFQVPNRFQVKSGPGITDIYQCDHCPYKSVKKPELKRHMFLLHRNRTNPESRKITDAKKRMASPPKAAPPSKKETEEKIEPLMDEKIECLACKFNCENESDLDKHMKEKHDGQITFQRFHIKEKTPKKLENNAKLVTTDMMGEALKKISSDTEKDTAVLKQKNSSLNEEVEVLKSKVTNISIEKEKETLELNQMNTSLVEELDVLKLKVTSLSTDLKHERDAIKNIKKEKEEVEKNYQEAARTIAEQQGQITIREEEIKVLGELLDLDGKISSEEVKEATTTDEGEDWKEVYEVTESGNMVPHQEKSTVTNVCKKCDKVLKSDHEVREHMKKHRHLINKFLNCDHCDYITKNENDLINHVVDKHSPKHTCDTCKSEFSTKTKLMEHILRDHGFTFTSNNQPTMQCHDCSEKFSTKPELMQHKKQTHYKTRLCPFYHGTGRGCSFPANICFNIHEENITPTQTEPIDYRKRIICKNGQNCVFQQRSTCFYKHVVNSVQSNQQPEVRSRNTPTQATSYNVLQTYKCTYCISEFVSKDDFEHHVRTAHRTRELESDTYATIVKIGQQMENVSQRLQFLELKSMTDFPKPVSGQRRI